MTEVLPDRAGHTGQRGLPHAGTSGCWWLWVSGVLVAASPVTSRSLAAPGTQEHTSGRRERWQLWGWPSGCWVGATEVSLQASALVGFPVPLPRAPPFLVRQLD